ncbi:MAG: DUF697 domain-containing protein [Cyanobacteria bacterium J069]|nr:MAG: DUF697 domain-containing protein [Cyanobacteria bacterium J069]
MVPKIRRPLVVGSVGLTASAWLLQLGHPTGAHWGEPIVWGAIALGGGLWWLKQQQPAPKLDTDAAPLDRTAVEQALNALEPLLDQLEQELAMPAKSADGAVTLSLQSGLRDVAPRRWRDRLAALRTELDRDQLNVAIIGGKSVGKTTLAQRLTADWLPSVPQTVTLTDTPALFDALDATSEIAIAAAADLVVFVASGDITDSEFQVLKELSRQHQRIVLAFNKQDQYLPGDRPLILQQIRERLLGQVPVQEVVAIAAAPAPLKVRQHQPDGTIQETLEQPAPDLAPLTERLTGIISVAGPQLVLNTTLRRAAALKANILASLNQLRRDRAMPLIEQAQWIAGAAAFATPMPSLDLLATGAINVQMVMDLGKVYQQAFSMEQAKAIATTMAETMVKLGLVEVSTQAIAPLLKSHLATFAVGGALQGVSAAYLTRVAGLSLVTYFEEQSPTAAPAGEFALKRDRLIQSIKAVFQNNQRTDFLQTLVQQAAKQLAPATTQPVALSAPLSAPVATMTTEPINAPIRP